VTYEKFEPDVGVADDDVVVEDGAESLFKEDVALLYLVEAELLNLLVGEHESAHGSLCEFDDVGYLFVHFFRV